MSSIHHQFNQGLADIAEQVQASLVQVQSGRGRGVGAGTVWHSDGLILTNAHVVGRRNHREILVTLADGRNLPATLLARDDAQDIAALRVDAQDLATITLGDSQQLAAGNLVFAIGHPWGILGAVSAGIVIGEGIVPLTIDPAHTRAVNQSASERQWLAIDLRLRPGNSGGPLVDSMGRLVGLNTAMSGPEVGLAVPVQTNKVVFPKVPAAENVQIPHPHPASRQRHASHPHYL